MHGLFLNLQGRRLSFVDNIAIWPSVEGLFERASKNLIVQSAIGHLGEDGRTLYTFMIQ